MDAGLAGMVLLNRYRLEHRLARGGMADVYRATDLRLGRPVAVKMPHPHFAADPAFVERLGREARAVAALAHPNVVTLYDQDEVDGRPFLVMELVEGESLSDLLDRQCPLPIDRAIAITLDVLAGLEHAHARGIVHRDVKPQNVLLAREGQAKLADFGIAQATAAAALTHAGEVLGSIHYLAPERLSGQAATLETDLYAVGVMLYLMLVGELPFEGDTMATIAGQHQHRDPVPLSRRRGELPIWMDEIVLRALAKDPAERYPSAAAMRGVLAGRQAAHNAPTGTIPIFSPSRLASHRPAWVAAVAGRQTFRRMALYAAALGAAVLLAGLGFLAARVPSSPDASSAAPAGTATPTSVVAAPPAPSAAALIPTLPPPTPTPEPPIPTATWTATPTPTLPPPTPTATWTPSPLQRLAELQALVWDATPSGDAGKEGRKIQKELTEIGSKINAGKVKDAREDIKDLVEEVQELATKGKIDPSLADELIRQLTALAAQLR